MKGLIIFSKQLKKKNFFLYKSQGVRLLDYTLSSRSLISKKHFNKNITVHQKFNNSFLKNGLKLKGLGIVNNAFLNFYTLFFNKAEGLKFSKYQDFLIFSKSDSNFFRKDFILSRIKDLLSSSFYLKIEKISKKLKKLKKFTKLRYKYKICFMPSSQRVNYLSKQFLIYVNTLKYFGVGSRLTEALYNVILEDKKSDLYKQKINFIKKFKK